MRLLTLLVLIGMHVISPSFAFAQDSLEVIVDDATKENATESASEVFLEDSSPSATLEPTPPQISTPSSTPTTATPNPSQTPKGSLLDSETNRAAILFTIIVVLLAISFFAGRKSAMFDESEE